ncbi:MAG: CHAD domain-containing protein, partial [Myxococcales bacterium]|nr:CHAD domain-containing protein [Myxococcales bacterium]
MSDEDVDAPREDVAPPRNPIADRVLERVAEAEVALATLLDPGENADTAELIHDYRVALRRLRSVLKPIGLCYGKKKARALADELREIANDTGELRDEEVLRETLAELELDGGAKEALGRWMLGRTRREAGLRARVTRHVRARADMPGGIRDVLERTRLLLSGPPKHELAPTALSIAAVEATLDTVIERTQAARPEDVDAMHRLRIGYKRLRYTLELVAGFFDFDAASGAKLAAKQQKLLGRLHDLDEAIVRIGRARGLPHASRERVLAALKKAR